MENNCCENKGKECCGQSVHNCCGNWKKCRIVRIIVCVLAVFIAFCFGVQWGEMRSDYRGGRFERGGFMMNQRYSDFSKFDNALGKVNVEVTKTAPAPTQTTTPKQ